MNIICGIVYPGFSQYILERRRCMQHSALLIGFLGTLLLMTALVPLGVIAHIGRRIRKGERHLTVHHQTLVYWFIGMVALGVVLTELAVRLMGGQWGPIGLRILHFCFVASTLLLAWRLTKATGLSNPTQHRKIVYWFIGVYGMTAATGTVLFFLHPSFSVG